MESSAELKPRAPSLCTTFTVNAASMLGSEHHRRGRNNQDACAVSSLPDLLCLVVTDGCGSGERSELGAIFGAHWLRAHLPRFWQRARAEQRFDPEKVASDANSALAEALGQLLAALGPSEEQPDLLQRFGLFTWTAAIADKASWAVLGLGDGVFAVNHHLTVFDAGQQNAPDYVGYRLLPPERLLGTPGSPPRWVCQRVRFWCRKKRYSVWHPQHFSDGFALGDQSQSRPDCARAKCRFLFLTLL